MASVSPWESLIIYCVLGELQTESAGNDTPPGKYFAEE